MSEPRKSIRGFVLENFLFTSEEKEFADGDSFLEQGIIDSTGFIELIKWLEETFSIQIQDEEMLPENLDSIDRVSFFIKKKTERGVAGAYL